MKKLLSIVSLLLLAALLLCACSPTVDDTASSDDSTDATTAPTEEETHEPGRYEFWLSDVSELAIGLDKESDVAKFYSLQTGYYSYYTLHEGTYVKEGTTLSIDIHDTTFVFQYNEEDDTYSIKNTASDQDDIVYTRVSEAPPVHPSYDFPVFADLNFTKDPALTDYRLKELKQMAIEEAGLKIFLNYYSTAAVESYPEITDRPIQMGDYINIDYIGYLNGAIIENVGATGAFVPVATRSEKIDNILRQKDFIQGLVGHSTGETFEIEVNYPEDHPNKAVAGKRTIFEVSVNAIYDVRLTNEQIKNYENLKFDTYEEYLDSVAKAIIYEDGIPYLVVEYGLADLLPKDSYMHFYQFYLDQAHLLAKRPPYEMEYEKYLTITGQSEEQMLAESKQIAADFLLAYYIADAFGLKWTTEQYEEQFEIMLDEYLKNAVNADKAEDLIATTRMDELYAELTYRIAGEWLANKAYSTN